MLLRKRPEFTLSLSCAYMAYALTVDQTRGAGSTWCILTSSLAGFSMHDLCGRNKRNETLWYLLLGRRLAY